jgi:hypothetical protein
MNSAEDGGEGDAIVAPAGDERRIERREEQTGAAQGQEEPGDLLEVGRVVVGRLAVDQDVALEVPRAHPTLAGSPSSGAS